MEYVVEGDVVAALVEARNAPWAIVPLNPNELSREPLDAEVRGATSTGIWNGFDDTIDDRCAFSLQTNKMRIDVKREGRTRATVHSQQRPKPSAARPLTTPGPLPRPQAPSGPRLISGTCIGSLCFHYLSTCTTPSSRRPPTMTQNL